MLVPQMLDVPYYRQTLPSTCGPAALMMVAKYWDDAFELSRKTEFKLWMKSNPLILFGGTLQFGLANTAVEMGFKAEIFQKARFSKHHSTLHVLLDLWENIAALSAYHARVPIHYGGEALDVIHEALAHKVPPIVFVSLEPILGENLLHWLVVTGIDEQTVYVNDPYVPEGSPLREKKGHPINLDRFRRAVATDSRGNIIRLPPCALLVYPLSPPKPATMQSPGSPAERLLISK